MAPTCDICGDAFTSVRRKRVQCNFCEKAACLICTQNYLLSTSSDPQCMFCRAAWNREFLDMHLPGTFRMGPLRQHRQRLLFERERSLFPDTMPAVERVLQAQEREREIARIEERIGSLQREYEQLCRERTDVRNRSVSSAAPSSGKRAVLCHCPATDCRGYIRASDGTCIVCSTIVCTKCTETVHEGRECNPDAVATARALAQETKPCPSCQVPIYRTEGCAQMWCTQCNTAFDWKTLAISRGNIHNPHYFEFVRQGGTVTRAPGDVVCGGFPRAEQLRSVLPPDPKFDHSRTFLFNALRIFYHVQEVELHNLRTRSITQPTNNESLRVRYLLKQISEEDLSSELWKAERRRERERAKLELLEMFCTVGVELFQRLVTGPKTPPHLMEETVQALESLRTYFNEESRRISKRFLSTTCGQVQKEFDSFWYV